MPLSFWAVIVIDDLDRELEREIENASDEMSTTITLLEMLYLTAKIYQHECCPPELQNLLRFELKRIFKEDNLSVSKLLTMNTEAATKVYNNKFYVYHNHRGNLVFGFKCKFCGKKNDHVDERKDTQYCTGCHKVNRMQPLHIR